MRMFSNDDVLAALAWTPLVEALRAMFRDGCESPLRSHLHIAGRSPGDLLIMPAWQSDRFIGVKIVTVFPGNQLAGQPAVSGLYLLLDAHNGTPLAQMDASVLTTRRTAAASVLAARHLARPQSRRLAILGTGKVSIALAEAYCASFAIEAVVICGRSLERSTDAARRLANLAPQIAAAVSVDEAVEGADIVASATLAREPLLFARHLQPGMHVDLVGAYRPDMREIDGEALAAADGIFVDTRDGGFKEAGDIVQALASGAISREAVRADLADLCRGAHPGRERDDEITVFKSVGAASEDLAAAALVFEAAQAERA